jgi:quercetin dioxygenase-like cupin family protein
MSTHHASTGEIVDLESWADDLPIEKNKAIVKTAEFELARLVLPAGKEFREHSVSGPVVIHCITGKVEVESEGSTRILAGGQLMHLAPADPHSLVSLEDSIILLTIVF